MGGLIQILLERQHTPAKLKLFCMCFGEQALTLAYVIQNFNYHGRKFARASLVADSFRQTIAKPEVGSFCCSCSLSDKKDLILANIPTVSDAKQYRQLIAEAALTLFNLQAVPGGKPLDTAFNESDYLLRVQALKAISSRIVV
jgi:hypothetical protein